MITEPMIIAAIAAFPGILTTLVSIYAIYKQVQRVHVIVNSEKDVLVALLQQSLIKVKELERTSRRALPDEPRA